MRLTSAMNTRTTWKISSNIWRPTEYKSFLMKYLQESWTSDHKMRNITFANIWKRFKSSSLLIHTARRCTSSKTRKVWLIIIWPRKTSNPCSIRMMSSASRAYPSNIFARHSRWWELRMRNRYWLTVTPNCARMNTSTRYPSFLCSRKSTTDLDIALRNLSEYSGMHLNNDDSYWTFLNWIFSSILQLYKHLI